MPIVSFTTALQRFAAAAPPTPVEAETVRDALMLVFAARPGLRGYVLDDQGAVRRHVAIYVKGEAIRDRIGLSDRVAPDDEIYVFQALTGG